MKALREVAIEVNYDFTVEIAVEYDTELSGIEIDSIEDAMARMSLPQGVSWVDWNYDCCTIQLSRVMPLGTAMNKVNQVKKDITEICSFV